MEDVTAIFISSKYIFYVSVWFFLNYLYKYSVYRISFCFIALVMISYLQYVHNSSKKSLHSVNLTQRCFLLNTVFICPSYRWDILWYTNVRPFTCCEPFGQFTSNFTELLELMVLRSVYFMVKFRIFIPELWDFIHQIVGDFSYVAL